ncbi:ADP-ribosyltransferase domain-containing protein [Aliivibrio fischeri]|uniref:NAD(+)--protein-arginine ADP-ribosyltransferase n=1 Tax=Aliivibrio fischeri TaxID=668 RepID=A0A510UMU7_ALIFS|nr:ADP-ribosyltransferase domain-containing protein [Aliivibrio fischeri]MUK51209.1 hypothetical protein [Aliivibrio fischeri]GEK16002.1 hypothetical protein AFI02nite_40380 [Aliivibrio fischeri]
MYYKIISLNSLKVRDIGFLVHPKLNRIYLKKCRIKKINIDEVLLIPSLSKKDSVLDLFNKIKMDIPFSMRIFLQNLQTDKAIDYRILNIYSNNLKEIDKKINLYNNSESEISPCFKKSLNIRNYNCHTSDMMNMSIDSYQATLEQETALRTALEHGIDMKSYLTSDQILIIKDYTINPDIYNEILKSGYCLDDPKSSFAKLFDETLNLLPEYEGITYRGTQSSRGNYGEVIKKGDFLYNDVFVSSSVSISIAKKFALTNSSKFTDSIMFAIKGRTGVNISTLSPTFKKEAEVLFRPNIYFKVKSIDKGKDDVVYVVLSETDDIDNMDNVRNMYDGQKLSFY